MRLFFLLFLCINFSNAEKLYERSYSTFYLATTITEENEELVSVEEIQNNLQQSLKVFLEKKVNNFSEKTDIKVDEEKGKVKISSNLHTMYQVENIFGNSTLEASQIKFHFTVYELKDNSNLLKMKPLDITPTSLRSLPDDQLKVISRSTLITPNGSSASLSNKNAYFYVTPQVAPDGYNIEVEMKCILNKGTYKHDTRFKCLDRSELTFQIQSKQGSNLYLVVSAVMMDYGFRPIARFTKKEVEQLKKEITTSEKMKLGLYTKFYTISVGIPSGGEGLIENDPPSPDFRQYFESMGVKFSDGSTVKFVQAAMRIVIHATEETHLQIEKILKDVGIETPQSKLLVRLIEIDNLVLAKLENGSLSIKGIQKYPFKVLENFDTYAVSGKTVGIREGDLDFDELEIGIDITPQSFMDDSRTAIEIKFKYTKSGHNFMLEKSLNLKNGSDQFFELQKSNDKTIFLIVYADKYIPETEFWYNR